MGRLRDHPARVNSAALDFQSVHDPFRPRVLCYVARLVGDGEAEDLTQSVMLKVSEGLHDFRGDSSLLTWIYRIATNAALDKLRGKWIQTVSEAEVARSRRAFYAAPSRTDLTRKCRAPHRSPGPKIAGHPTISEEPEIASNYVQFNNH